MLKMIVRLSMKVADLVSWAPFGLSEPTLFVGIVLGEEVEYPDCTRVLVLWNESATPTMSDKENLKILSSPERTRETR